LAPGSAGTPTTVTSHRWWPSAAVKETRDEPSEQDLDHHGHRCRGPGRTGHNGARQRRAQALAGARGALYAQTPIGDCSSDPGTTDNDYVIAYDTVSGRWSNELPIDSDCASF
jgi:hypothetical protein